MDDDALTKLNVGLEKKVAFASAVAKERMESREKAALAEVFELKVKVASLEKQNEILENIHVELKAANSLLKENNDLLAKTT